MAESAREVAQWITDYAKSAVAWSIFEVDVVDRLTAFAEARVAEEREAVDVAETERLTRLAEAAVGRHPETCAGCRPPWAGSECAVLDALCREVERLADAHEAALARYEMTRPTPPPGEPETR